MPLQNLIRLRKADATAIFFGGVVKLEDFVLDFLRNTCALVADFGHDGVIFPSGGNRKRSAARHRLHSIDDDVEEGLLHQVEIHFDE